LIPHKLRIPRRKPAAGEHLFWLPTLPHVTFTVNLQARFFHFSMFVNVPYIPGGLYSPTTQLPVKGSIFFTLLGLLEKVHGRRCISVFNVVQQRYRWAYAMKIKLMWLIINDSFRNFSDKISYCCIIASRTNHAGLVQSLKPRRQLIGLSLLKGTFK
jgi:hypothetical protein